MERRNFIILIVCLLLSLIGYTPLKAQYKVTGSRAFLAIDDTRNRIQVLVVENLSAATLEFSSEKVATAKAFSYKQKALEAVEEQASIQDQTLRINNLKHNMGYFVAQEGVLPRYVWLLDYSIIKNNTEKLLIDSEHSDPCERIVLRFVPEIQLLTYYTPSGVLEKINREIKIQYDNLVWDEEKRNFIEQREIEYIEGEQTKSIVYAPLKDTKFICLGDRFDEAFDQKISIETEFYLTSAVEAHVIEQENNNQSDNKETNSDVKSAPLDVSFTCIANQPVAVQFIWKIYRNEDGADNPLIRFTGTSINYTFRESGRYTVELTIGDRSGKCVSTPYSKEFVISESALSEPPNVFSPGITPGINDVFKVQGNSLVDFEGFIFSRWGVELFHWTSLQDGWDGKYKGSYVAPGVYYYIIKATGADGVKYTKKGSVTVIRSKTIGNEISND